jgi:hypothetical protein
MKQIGGTMKGHREVDFHDFREHFETYLQSGDAIAVMQDGRRVGIFIPLKPMPIEPTLLKTGRVAIPDDVEVRWEAFEESAARLDGFLEKCGITEDEVVEEFERLRRESRRANRG